MEETKGKTVGELTVNDLAALKEEITARARQFAYDMDDSRVYCFQPKQVSVQIYLNDKYNETPHRHQEPVVSACCVKTGNVFEHTKSVDDLHAWMQEQFAKLKTPAERERIHLAAKLSEEAGLAQHYSPELRKLWMAAWERAMKDSGLLALVDDTGAA